MGEALRTFTVGEGTAGRRLDAVLELLLPELGLRGRRRACEQERALVNGRARPAAYKVRPGDVLTLADPAGSAVAVNAFDTVADNAFGGVLRPERAGGERAVRVLPPEGRGEAGAENEAVGELIALFKPAGMHSEALAGKPGESLCSLLAGLLPGARLLNRLDCATSGIVMAALDAEGVRRWQAAQEGGLTRKYYLALLQGRLDGARLATQRLILKGRERVLVEMAEHTDPRRHTLIVPLARIAPEGLREATGLEGEATLAGCLILKGARHQIRAHAASLGHPLLGDARYGATREMTGGTEERAGDGTAELERFWLHHGRIELPGFAARCVPPWLEALGAEAYRAGEDWLSGGGYAVMCGVRACSRDQV